MPLLWSSDSPASVVLQICLRYATRSVRSGVLGQSSISLGHIPCVTLKMMKGRVLIIDNDREHADVLSTKLAGFGYEVRTELSSHSAVETADLFSPTAIVADPFADEFDPFGLLRELRLQQPHTPIILTARNTSIEIALRAIQEEGADHYF